VCDQPELPYPRLLGVAYELGRADGCLARDLQACDLRAWGEAQDDGRPGDRCRGRAPQEFAALLWADRPGAPPAGLEVNAPLWYAAGFRAGLVQPPECSRPDVGRPPRVARRQSRGRR
jgi:hypothetical protein